MGLRADPESFFLKGVGSVFGFQFSKLLAFYILTFNALHLN